MDKIFTTIEDLNNELEIYKEKKNVRETIATIIILILFTFFYI